MQQQQQQQQQCSVSNSACIIGISLHMTCSANHVADKSPASSALCHQLREDRSI